MIIREATKDDLSECLVLGWEMHQESRYKNQDFNLEKVALFFEIAIHNHKYLFLVGEKEGKIIGGFIGYIMAQWFGDDLQSGDFAVFIEKEHRGGRLALGLIKKYIAWAKSKGVNDNFIGLGITTDVNTEKTEVFYKKLGFNRTGLTMGLN